LLLFTHRPTKVNEPTKVSTEVLNPLPHRFKVVQSWAPQVKNIIELLRGSGYLREPLIAAVQPRRTA
jgi:hypothetical protein